MRADTQPLPPLPNTPRAPRRPRKGKQWQPTHDSQQSYLGDQYLLEEDESDPETLVHTSFRRGDDASIIDLALAIQNLTRQNITVEQQKNGHMHLKRYLTTFAKVRPLFVSLNYWLDSIVQIRGLENMAPNHHLCTHVPERIEDYGPVPQMWAYGSERLNRQLKNIRTNRHAGGTIENTYANTFFRQQALSAKVQ